MSEQKPNWVALRSAAHMDDVFEELCTAVEADVKEIENLPSEQRGGYTFCAKKERGMLRVSANPRSGGPPTVVIFQQEGERNNILIQTFFPPPRESRRLLLTSKWNQEELSRELSFVGEKQIVKLWQVSQRALEPLLPDP